MTDLKTPLTTIEEAQAFIKSLVAEGKDFHLEDDPDEIINGKTGCMLFTEEEADLVRQRVDELYAFDWGICDCPIGYMLDVINPDRNLED